MTRTETIVDEQREHRGHYVTVEVTATPPLPHDESHRDDGDAKFIVSAKLYDGPPLGELIYKDYGGDLIYKNETVVEPGRIQDRVTDAVERATSRIDSRVAQRETIKCQAESGLNAVLDEPEEGDDDVQVDGGDE